jgi:hypothetical protein
MIPPVMIHSCRQTSNSLVLMGGSHVMQPAGLKMWFWVSASFLSGVWSIILGMFLASSYTSNTAALDPGFYYVAAQRAAQVLKKAQ